MRLICYWQQRQLARYMVLGEAVRPQSFLGRHLARCEDCAHAQQEIACLQSDMAAFSRPTLAPNFDARLQARLQSDLGAGLEIAGQNAPASQAVRAFPFPLRLALAGIPPCALALWYLGPTANLPRDAAGTPKRNSLTSLPSPRKIDPGRKSIVFNTINTNVVTKSDIKRVDALPHPGASSALRARVPYPSVRGERRRYLVGHVYHHRRRISSRFDKALYAHAPQRHTGNPPGAQQSVSPGVSLLTPAMCSARNWHAIGEVYETCGDFSRASQAYGQAFADQPDAGFALAASENAERAGDRGASLEYYARALSGEPGGSQPGPSDTDTDTDTKGNLQ